MRELTGHRVNPANDQLQIRVTDDPGAGGACHRYELGGFNTSSNPSAVREGGMPVPQTALTLLFQNGPIGEAGVNGITHEALLEILIDRLRSFQDGPFRCDENETALDALRAAQAALLSRTQGRMARGVEGTHQL